jgi:uncharacterized protein
MLYRRDFLKHSVKAPSVGLAGLAFAWPLGSWAQAPANEPGAHPPGAGEGLGWHNPLSPVAPLKERDDVVPWRTLGLVTQRLSDRTLVPVFSKTVEQLHQKTVRLQGFMAPLDPGERQDHFLLSSVPPTCAFCSPGGPESVVQVRAQRPIRYTTDAMVIEGRFHVLKNDEFGFYYRMTQARLVT